MATQSIWTIEDLDQETKLFYAWRRKEWPRQLRYAAEYALLASAIFSFIAWCVSLFHVDITVHVMVVVAVVCFALFFMYGLVDFLSFIRFRRANLNSLYRRVEAGECVEKPSEGQLRTIRRY